MSLGIAPPKGQVATLLGISFSPVDPGAAKAPPAPAKPKTPLKALSTQLVETYRTVNPSRQEQQVLRRVLTQPSNPVANGGLDNELGDLIVAVGDQIVSPGGKPFEVLKHLGRGTFGQVLKVQSGGNKVYAVKVIRNRPAFLKQAEMEVEVLQQLRVPRSKDADGKDAKEQAADPRALVVQMHDHFVYKNHLCLVFEELGVNLLQLLQQNHCRGLSISLIRYFTKQLLKVLQLLRDMRIVHCDIKPENILLQNLHSPAIKLIDFGSACYTTHQMHTYIQSRFYRSPEVLLGCAYGGGIDMWSLGSIVGELFLGLPLFPGESEYNQLYRIVQMRGPVPDGMISAGSLAHKFFAPAGSLPSNGEAAAAASVQAVAASSHFRFKSEAEYCREMSCPPCRNKQYFKHTRLPELISHHPRLKPLESEAEKAEDRERRGSMLHFLEGLLRIDPTQRWTPRQALRHPFVTGEPFQTDFAPPEDAEPAAKPTGSTPPTGNGAGASGAPSPPNDAAGAAPPGAAVPAAATVHGGASALQPSPPPAASPPAAVAASPAVPMPPRAAVAAEEAPAAASPHAQSQPQPVQGVWNGNAAPRMMGMAPPMCYSPGMAYSSSPPAYYGSPPCALSPPSMQSLSIAMTDSPSSSFGPPQYFYGCSSPPDRSMGAMGRVYGSSPPQGGGGCYGGGCYGEGMSMGGQMMPPQMMEGWSGEWGGQCMGGAMPQYGGSMPYEGGNFGNMCAAGPHSAPQYAPVHGGCGGMGGQMGGPPFYGHAGPGYQMQGEYSQQQYFIPGPPAAGAPPMRLSVNTGSSGGGKGQRQSRERKRNSKQGAQERQSSVSPKAERPTDGADGHAEPPPPPQEEEEQQQQQQQQQQKQSGEDGKSADQPMRLSFSG